MSAATADGTIVDGKLGSIISTISSGSSGGAELPVLERKRGSISSTISSTLSEETSRTTLVLERKRSITFIANSPGSFRAQPFSPWSDTTFAVYEPPSFRDEWHHEFNTLYYRPRALMIGSSLMTVAGLGLCALHVLDEDGGRGGESWAALNWGGELLCGAVSVFVLALLCIPACQPFCKRYYSVIAAVWTATCIIAWNSVLAFDELRRSQFQMPFELGGTANITYSRNTTVLAGGLHVAQIVCRDDDVITTMLYRSQRFETAGCIPGFLNGGVVAFNAAMYSLPQPMHMSPVAAKVAMFVAFVGQLGIGVGVGLSLGHFCATMVLLGLVGSWSSYYAHQMRVREKWDFACTKTLIFVARQHRTLLHSLIPRNVLERVCMTDDMSAAEVPLATVMFCELDMSSMDVNAVDAFVGALSDLLGKLDKEVKRRGMFKYQHVATGSKHSFIVCCPRVSCPYDKREQSRDYPIENVRALFLLAFDMIDIAQRSVGWPYADKGGNEQGVRVRVGLSRGPIATVVLGICRRYAVLSARRRVVRGIWRVARGACPRLCELIIASAVPDAILARPAAGAVPARAQMPPCGETWRLVQVLRHLRRHCQHGRQASRETWQCFGGRTSVVQFGADA